MSTIVVTPEQLVSREVVSGFARAVEVPPHVREAMIESLRAWTPGGIPVEHQGWILHALGASLMDIVRLSVEVTGSTTTANTLISPLLLAVIASAAESLVVESELPDV